MRFAEKKGEGSWGEKNLYKEKNEGIKEMKRYRQTGKEQKTSEAEASERKQEEQKYPPPPRGGEGGEVLNNLPEQLLEPPEAVLLQRRLGILYPVKWRVVVHGSYEREGARGTY